MLSDATLRRYLSEPTVALVGDLVRALIWAGCVMLWLAFGQVYVRMIRLTLENPSGSDFTIFYYTARMVADGLPMYGESPARYGLTWVANHLGNLNPPHFQLLFAPLSSLSYGQALAVWVAVSFACVVAALVMVFRELGVRLTLARVTAWGALTIGLAPFTTVAVTCEMTFVLMLPFVLMWRAWRQGRWTAVGVWLGVLVSLKLFLLVLAAWLGVQRQWRGVAACVVSAAALVVLGGAVFGFDAYRLWIQSLGTVGWEWMAMNASWPGLVSRVLQGSPKIEPVVLIPWLVRPAAAVGCALVLAATVQSTWHAVSTPEQRDRQLLVLVLGAILASPLGWVYYLPLAYAPMLGWLSAGHEWSGATRLPRTVFIGVVVAVVLLYIPQEVANAGQPSIVATATLASTYFFATAVLWSSALCRVPSQAARP